MDVSVRMILEIEIKPEVGADFEAGMRTALPETRAYGGCISVDVMRRVDNPNAWVLVEEWETQGHHERYVQWRIETGMMAKWEAVMTGPPSMAYLNAVDV